MKCLPASKISQANGVALHDWHAEVLTLRAFNRFILDECRRLAQDDSAESDYLARRSKADLSSASPQPFSWRESLTLHMYCSEAPCLCPFPLLPGLVHYQLTPLPKNQAATPPWN